MVAYLCRHAFLPSSLPAALAYREKKTPPQGELGGMESRVKNRRMLASVTFSSMPLL
jgi:hypothetical protein